jgi:acyl carrier protein
MTDTPGDQIIAGSTEGKSADMDEMKDVVLEYVVDEYVDEDEDIEVTFDTPLISSGLVDSFSMVSLKVFLEKKYQISLPDSAATPEAFDTVNSIVELVKRHKG